MIITVADTAPVEVPGLARVAHIQIDGDKAIVAVRTADLTGARRVVGRKVEFMGASWVAGAHQPTSQVQTYTFRRLADG